MDHKQSASTHKQLIVLKYYYVHTSTFLLILVFFYFHTYIN